LTIDFSVCLQDQSRVDFRQAQGSRVCVRTPINLRALHVVSGIDAHGDVHPGRLARHLESRLGQTLARIYVGPEIGQVTADEGAANREAHPVVVAHAHNLDIFSRFAVGDLKLPTVQRALNSENDPFKIGERRKPSAARGIINERYKPGPMFEELG
jgi:hypothetical protein